MPPEGSRAVRSSRADATSVEGARALYRLQAPIYDLTRWLFLRDRASAVRRLDLAAGQRVLEVGCGTGTNLLALRSRVGETGEVHGIDLSPDMLLRARRKLDRRGYRNVHLHEEDAGRFDLGGPFDAILFSYSLSMIPRWRESLAAAARHLAPGGRLVIVDFSDLRRSGLVRRPLRAWLHAHHVEPERPVVEALVDLFSARQVEVEDGWIHFVARCVRACE